jgi:hypothetical protein
MYVTIINWKHITVIIRKPVCNCYVELITLGIGLSWAVVASRRVSGLQGFRLPYSLDQQGFCARVSVLFRPSRSVHFRG